MRPPRVWALAVLGVLVVAALPSAAGSKAHPPVAWTGPELHVAALGVDAADQRLVDSVAELDEGARGQLRTDLERLAGAWATGGGADGFPFWEKAWRAFEADDLAASTLRDYTVSYLDLLHSGRERVAGQSVDTDAARVVRDRLVRAIDLRLKALAGLVDYLELRRDRSKADPADRRERLEAAVDGLQASYRATRLAMNASQAMLLAAERPLLSDSAFQ